MGEAGGETDAEPDGGVSSSMAHGVGGSSRTGRIAARNVDGGWVVVGKMTGAGAKAQ